MAVRKRYNRNSLTLALVAAMLLPTTAFAQDAGAQPQQKDEGETEQAQGEGASKTLETVSVVGSRIKRAQVEGPSPVTIISAEQIEAQGFNTVHEALETISQNVGFGQNDFNANGGFTPNAGVINLRGMGPGRTLLLINGRRANDYPFPYNGRSNFQNFNNIPAGAVERIEVLAGGASAIYGSDAVAGVVNVVLKSNYEGNNLRTKAQTTTEGGGTSLDIQWTGGKAFDRGSLTYAFEHFDRSPLFAYQRDAFDSGADNPAPPGVNGSAGVGGYQPSIGIQIRRLNPSTGATLGYLQPAGRDCSASEFYRDWTYTSSSTGATLGPGCGYDRYVAEQTIVNGTVDTSAYVIGNLDFTDNLSGWASVMAYKSNASLGGGVEQWFGGPQPNGTFYDPQFGTRIFPIRALTVVAYGGSNGTFQKFKEESWELAAGLRGTIADRFDWDFTLSKAEYNADRTRPRMTVSGATAYFLGNRLGTTGTGAYAGLAGIPNGLPVYKLNLDRFYGAITPEDYASMSTQVTYDAQSENSLANFSITGDLFSLPGGSAAFAAVLEASSQSYKLDTDRRIFPDIREIYNLTGTGGGGERDRYAVGLEMSFPILKSLTVSAAGRYDKYDDITAVDDAVTWNGGLEWRPFESLLIRGTYATSFKAPDMHYVFAERSGSFGTVTDFELCRQNNIAATLCGASGANYNYSAFTTSQGAPGLEEETGNSWSTGFVWDVTDNLALTADYYEIELESEVAVISGTTIIQDEYGCATGTYTNGQPFPYASGSSYCNEIAARITRDPLNGNRITEIRSGPVNLSYRKVTGVDANVRWAYDTNRMGRFTTTFTWSHIISHETKLRADSALANYRDNNGTSDFRSRAAVQLDWRKDSWFSTLYVFRLGSFPRWNLNNTLVTSGELDSRAGPHTVANVSVGKRFSDKLTMRLNVNNVLNDLGTEDPTYNSYPYVWYGYGTYMGRQVGLEVNYSF